MIRLLAQIALAAVAYVAAVYVLCRLLAAIARRLG